MSSAKCFLVALTGLGLVACAQVRTVNGVDIQQSRPYCEVEPAVCIAGVAIAVAAGALVYTAVADNDARRDKSFVTVTNVMTSQKGDTIAIANDSGAIAIASDAKLKGNIAHVYTTPSGIRLYAFRYIGDERHFVGVLAQELLEDVRFRHAVSRTTDGFYAVNYGALGLQLLRGDVMKHAGEQARIVARS